MSDRRAWNWMRLTLPPQSCYTAWNHTTPTTGRYFESLHGQAMNPFRQNKTRVGKNVTFICWKEQNQAKLVTFLLLKQQSPRIILESRLFNKYNYAWELPLTTVRWVLLHGRVLQPLLSAVSRRPALHPINAMTLSVLNLREPIRVKTHLIWPPSIVLNYGQLN